MNIKKKIGRYLINKSFIRTAIDQKADLSAFKNPPPHIVAKNIFGVSLIAISYAIGWPLIALLGYISYNLNQPLIIVIGGPVAYGISHLVFWIGMYITGKEYTIIFSKWLSRVITERLIGDDIEHNAASE